MVIFSTYTVFSCFVNTQKSQRTSFNPTIKNKKQNLFYTCSACPADGVKLQVNYPFFFLISSALSSCVIKLAPWNNISGQLAEHPELVSVENLKMISRVKDGRHSKSLFSCVVEKIFPQWTVGGGMTHNLFPATAAEMCCLSSICMCVCMLVCDPFKMSH